MRSVCLNSNLCSLAPWYLVRAHTYSDFEANDVLICHLGPISEKRNHFSVLICLLKGIDCLQNHRRAVGSGLQAGPSEITPRNRLSNRPSRGETTDTAEFQMALLAAIQGSRNCSPKLPLSSQQLETDGCLHSTCLLTATKKALGTDVLLTRTQRFCKPACQH